MEVIGMNTKSKIAVVLGIIVILILISKPYKTDQTDADASEYLQEIEQLESENESLKNKIQKAVSEQNGLVSDESGDQVSVEEINSLVLDYLKAQYSYANTSEMAVNVKPYVTEKLFDNFYNEPFDADIVATVDDVVSEKSDFESADICRIQQVGKKIEVAALVKTVSQLSDISNENTMLVELKLVEGENGFLVDKQTVQEIK